VPYYFEFDSANRILRCRFEGGVTDHTVREYYEIAVDYVARTTPQSGITDFMAVTTFEVTPETIRELASLPPLITDPSLPRFIIAGTPLIFGMARMFELAGQATRPNLHVVRSMKEACVIMGIPEAKFGPIPD
jgi:hypothetical protein